MSPVTDSTNSNVLYKRNRVRHEVLPYIKKYFNSAIVENISRQAVISKEDEDFLNEQANINMSRLKSGEGYLIAGFCKLHPAIKRRIIRLIINSIKGNLNMIEAVHVDKCIELIEKGETGKMFCLPDGIVIEIQYDIFKIQRMKQKFKYEHVLHVPGTAYIKEAEMSVETTILKKNSSNFIATRFIKYFDYGKINNMIKFRNRLNGDYIYPSGMTGKKKLKDFFIDNKVPRDDRDSIPLIACGSEILWIVGIRTSENFKVDEKTKDILQIKIKEKK